MTENEFVRIKTFVKSRYGIDLSNKKVIVEGRLDNYVRNKGWKDFTVYMDEVEADKSGKLEKKLVDLLTTNHTYFMREFEQFEFFKQEVLPWLKKKESKSKDLHIWCGASSSGEEPYTLAMIVKDFFGLESEKWDTTILATDISTEVLKQAVDGIYTEEQISTLPDSWKRRYFRHIVGTDNYQVTDDLKREVLFRKLNLMDKFPFRKKIHVIFLRNVMIYFDDKTKKELLKKVYDALEPGGYLFLGQTETLDRGVIPFKLVKPSIFRK